jgi:hypothetical protein
MIGRCVAGGGVNRSVRTAHENVRSTTTLSAHMSVGSCAVRTLRSEL